MRTRSKRWLRTLACMAFAACCSAALADPRRVEVRPPDGLGSCSPTGAFSQMAKQGLSKFGELIGCFVSQDQVELQISPKVVSEPLEYAFVVVVTPAPKPYTTGDVQTMYVRAGEQWKDQKPIDQQPRNLYEKQLTQIAIASQPHDVPAANAQLAPPVPVSIERIGSDSYVVMTIRQRKVVQGDQAIITSAVDATAITLRSGNLLRLSITRELQAPTDVDHVRNAMGAWIASIGGR